MAKKRNYRAGWISSTDGYQIEVGLIASSFDGKGASASLNLSEEEARSLVEKLQIALEGLDQACLRGLETKLSERRKRLELAEQEVKWAEQELRRTRERLGLREPTPGRLALSKIKPEEVFISGDSGPSLKLGAPIVEEKDSDYSDEPGGLKDL